MAAPTNGEAKRRRLSFDAARRHQFVVGNEAADCDSLVSAIALAHLLDSPEVQATALAQIARAEFRLRGDVLLLFREAGLPLADDGSPLDLHFWDEVDWSAVRELSSRDLVLVDHNKMTPKVHQVFENRVSWILDHHSDSKSYPAAVLDLDGSLGSVCTLVAEKYFQKYEGRLHELPREFGRLLAGVILLDCRNFGNSHGENSRGTQRDRAALVKLKAFIPEVGETAWYQEIAKARSDVSHLSVKELLMLDMKVEPVAGFAGPGVAFCSMMATLDVCCKMEDGPGALLERLRAYGAEGGYQAVVALFARDDAGHKAIVFVPTTDVQQPLCDAVEARLAGVPGNLPAALQENPLYESQGILSSGFGLELRSDLAPLRAFSMRKEITRKSLLPRAVASEEGQSSL